MIVNITLGGLALVFLFLFIVTVLGAARHADEECPPFHGDQFELYLIRLRNACDFNLARGRYYFTDDVLSDYKAHIATGTPLDRDVPAEAEERVPE